MKMLAALVSSVVLGAYLVPAQQPPAPQQPMSFFVTSVGLGNGANLPVSEEQLKSVLGSAQAQDFARHLGLPVDQTLALLAKYLPEIVDKASPNGTLQPGG